MLKLMDKKIYTILLSQFLFIWTFALVVLVHMIPVLVFFLNSVWLINQGYCFVLIISRFVCLFDL